MLNELINKNTSLVKITEILEILEIMENCTSCKDKIKGKKHFKEFCKLINKIEKHLVKLGKRERKDILSSYYDYEHEDLFKMNTRLNDEILCEICKEKKIEKLTDKC